MFWEVHRPVPICGQLIFPQSHYLITPCYFVNFTRSQKKSCYKHYQSTLINKSLKTYQTNPIDSFNCFSMSRQTVKFRLHVTEKTSTLYLYPPTCKKMFNCFTCSVYKEHFIHDNRHQQSLSILIGTLSADNTSFNFCESSVFLNELGKGWN